MALDTPFLSEITMVSFNFPPKGYALCNGQLLPISQHNALFSLLGTTFGGNGQTNFALPNFRGRIPVHQGNGFDLGDATGATFGMLTQATMPQHAHQVTGTLTLQAGDAATTGSAAGAFLAEAAPGSPRYNATGDDRMAIVQADQLLDDPADAPLMTEPNTSSQQPFNNMMPYTCINFIIALEGIFPSQT